MKPPDQMTDEEINRELAKSLWEISNSWGGTPHVNFPDAPVPLEDFDPLADANDMLMLIEAMREKGFAIDILARAWDKRYTQPYRCQIYDTFCPMTNRVNVSESSCAHSRAVCLASIKATRAIKESE